MDGRDAVRTSPGSPALTKVPSLVKSIVLELFAAFGCTTLAAVPSTVFAYAMGLDTWVCVAVGGLLAYAVLTGYAKGRRAREAAPEPVDAMATLRARLAEVDAHAAAARGGHRSEGARLRLVR